MSLYMNASGQVRCGAHARFGDVKLVERPGDACSHFQCRDFREARERRRAHAPGWNSQASHLGSCDPMINCRGCD